MVQVVSIYEPVQEGLERVKENLKSLSKASSPYLVELIDHALEPLGKRIRPAITLLASNFHPHNDGHVIETMASAVELLHIATLIHDDTVDSSDTRRGKATVSRVWGRNAAVLLGDYLLATSATLVCDTGNIRVIRQFAETLMDLSSGELNELVVSYDPGQSREQYIERINRKTASLFTTAGETGAILSQAPETIVQALRNYGLNLGTAFQIVDDILDFDGTSEEVGKPVGNDLAQGILTLPGIMAAERYPGNNPISVLFQNPDDKDSLRQAVEFIQNLSVIEDSYAVAERYCRRALRSIQDLGHNSSKRSLEGLVEYVLSRRS